VDWEFKTFTIFFFKNSFYFAFAIDTALIIKLSFIVNLYEFVNKLINSISNRISFIDLIVLS
jgi:hypothetical protein